MGLWHIQYRKEDGKIVDSVNHRSKNNAVKYAEIDDAKEIILLVETDRTKNKKRR